MMIRRRLAAGVAVLALALGQAACTTLRPVEVADDGAVPAAIQIGHQISVADTSGNDTKLTVTAVGRDFIEGRTESNLPVRIAVADVKEIRLREVGVGKTVGLGVGVGLAALFWHGLVNMAIFP